MRRTRRGADPGADPGADQGADPGGRRHLGGYRALARCLLVGTAVAGLACSASGQREAAPGLPVVFDRLEGAWEGTGTLMGRDAAFALQWSPNEAGDTVRLDFSNAFRAADGTVTPVLEAVAYYRSSAEGRIVAEWTDSRPQSITIVATATDSILTSEWIAPSERGRTEYRVNADGTLSVRDWVYVDGEPRPFGEATYRPAPVAGG